MTAKSSRTRGERLEYLRTPKSRQKRNGSHSTWDDVANWAGVALGDPRGRAYQRGGRVRGICGISAEGKLLATVAGGHRYATGVWWEADARFCSRCTCRCRLEWLQARGRSRRYISRNAGEKSRDPDCGCGGWKVGRTRRAEFRKKHTRTLKTAIDSEDDEGLQPSEFTSGALGKGRAADDEKIRKHINAKNTGKKLATSWVCRSLSAALPRLCEKSFAQSRIALRRRRRGSPHLRGTKRAAESDLGTGLEELLEGRGLHPGLQPTRALPGPDGRTWPCGRRGETEAGRSCRRGMEMIGQSN